MQAVVLHSGGLDSTLCLMMAIGNYSRVLSLGINYGQHHAIELDYAKVQCERLNVERKVIDVKWDKPARSLPVGRELSEIRSGVSPAFLPGRNAVFLMLACAEAAGIGASDVLIGVNSVDYSGYSDCTKEFVGAFNVMLDTAMPGAVSVVAPLQNMSKREIAKKAHGFGLASYDTWSCYRPKIGESGVVPCGVCDACVLHEYAWGGME